MVGETRLNSESEKWINHWLELKEKYIRLGKPLSELNDRIIRHKASQCLGRGFGESVESYYNRTGLTEYHKWRPEY